MRERSGRGEGGETSEGGREHNGVAMAAAATSVYLETRIVATLAHSAATRLCATCPWLSRYRHTERKRSDTKAEHERTLACVGGTGCVGGTDSTLSLKMACVLNGAVR